MENFQDIIRQASHLKQSQLKKDRLHYQSLPNFLKNSLSYSKKYAHLRKQHFYLQMFTSDNIKKNGNDLIKQNKYQEALKHYEESLAIFRYIETRTQQNMKDADLTYKLYELDSKEGDQLYTKEQQQLYKKHMLSLYLNISLCLIKLNKKQQSILSVKQAIKIDSNNPKCYYRMGQSYVKYINRTQHDINEGIKWLQKAYQLNNDDSIKKEIDKIKKEADKQNAKSKKIFSFIMNQNDNNKHLRDSVCSDKQKMKVEVQKKERSNSAQRKSNRISDHNRETQKLKQAKSCEQNLNSERDKNLLMQKQLNRIKLNQLQKKAKTQQKLLKISYKQNYQIHLLQNFILNKGYKISSLIEMCGNNYKDYLQQHRKLFHKCNILYQKTNQKQQKFIDNEGEQVTLNFQDKETKQYVNQQKLKVYNEYMKWLRNHPIEPIKKYTQRYNNQLKFIEQQIQQRKLKSQSVNKVFYNKRQQNRKQNMKYFYIGIALIMVWIIYNNVIA